MRRYQVFVCVCLMPIAIAASQLPDRAPNPNHDALSSQEFRPPEGFGGYAWKTSLGKADRLEPEPVYVRVAHSIGKVTFFDYSCYQSISRSRDGGIPGNHVLAMQVCRETDGSGYHALAEYYVDSQGFRITDEKGRKVVFFPLTYQFCSQWIGFSYEFKGDPMEQMQLCGVRFHFRSETAAQAASMADPEHRTAYERILNWLIRTHGEPKGFKRRALVYIPQWDLDPIPAKKAFADRHRNWQWCPPVGDELVPRCEASIVLNFDAETGRGQVLYSTGPVWAYAHARQFGGSEGDELYFVLRGGIKPPKVRHQCMESFLCRPPKPMAMPEEMLKRFRVTEKKE